jgi:hypothetical protein
LRAPAPGSASYDRVGYFFRKAFAGGIFHG